jgi:hypothetical protein
MNTRIPELSIALTTEGLIELEQQNGLDEPDRIEIHPLHLRHMAEKMGLVGEMSASEADALRMVDKLARRLKMLHERIDRLDDLLLNCSDHAHANLDWEVSFSRATCDLADEFVREIEESGAVVTPRGSAGGNGLSVTHTKPKTNPAETQRVLTAQMEIA